MTSTQKDLARKALQAAAAYVRQQIKADAANRYSLLAPWELPAVRCSSICRPFSYDGEYLSIIPAGEDAIRVTVLPYTSTAEHPVCDGCSLSPDLHGCLEAAIIHDPWYLSLESMSRQTGLPESTLRELGDLIFGNIIVALRGDGIIARTYYWAVRIFGGLYHRTKHAILAILLTLGILALSGCAGCAIPSIFDDPVTPPVFEKVSP